MPHTDQELKLAESIRRQLMEGNYDYAASQEQPPGARRDLAGPAPGRSEGPARARYLRDEGDEGDARRHYVPFTFDRDLPPPPPLPLDPSAPTNQSVSETERALRTTSLKYKVIKVRLVWPQHSTQLQ